MTALADAGLKYPASTRKGYRLSVGRIGLYAVLIVAAVAFSAPLWIVLTTSFKTAEEVRLGSIFALPNSLNFDAWKIAWSSACTGVMCEGLRPSFWNSIKITVASVGLSVLLGALNGYALSLWRFRFADTIMAALLVGAFIPLQVVLYPLVKIMSTAGLYATLPGVIFLHVIFALPYTTLVFRNFYLGIPNDLLRAAKIEGAGFFATFWYIVLPMSTNVAIVAIIMQFTGTWNDYIIGVIFAGNENTPMTVQLNNIVATGKTTANYSVNMAAAALAAIPPLLVYFIAGRYFVKSIGSGAVKG